MIALREIGARIGTGLKETWWAALSCSLVAMAIYRSRGEAIAASGGPALQQLIAVYFGVALASGALLGFLKPYAKGLRAALVYMAVVWPYAFAVVAMSQIDNLSRLDRFDVVGSVVIAVLGGPIVAAFVHVLRKNEVD